MSRSAYNVRYTHAASSSSAARATRYISRRPEAGQQAERDSQWRDLRAEEGQTIGDEEAFKAESKRRRDEKRESAAERGKDLSRDKSPAASQYVHLTISPDHEMSDEELKDVAREWTHDREGNEMEHFGAIHRDTDHHHLHLLIARDKIGGKELEGRKEASDERIQELERERELEREIEHPERALEAERDMEEERRRRELELERGHEQER